MGNGGHGQLPEGVFQQLLESVVRMEDGHRLDFLIDNVQQMLDERGLAASQVSQDEDESRSLLDAPD
jgi:hypothetical protein